MKPLADLIQALMRDPFSGMVTSGGSSAGMPIDDDGTAAGHHESGFGETIESATRLIISQLNLKQAAGQMPEGPIKREMLARVDSSLSEFMEDFCGHGAHVIPFAWPGPPPWVMPTVTRLSVIASVAENQKLKDSILDVAAIMVEKAYSSSAKG